MRNGLPALMLLGLLGLLACSSTQLPPHPDALVFPKVGFEVPDPASLRFELSSGVPVYAAQDHQLPLVTVSILFHGGSYLDPSGNEGLSGLTAAAWPAGGAGDRGPRELDEELAYLAAELSIRIGPTSGSVTLDMLAKDLDESMRLLADLLAHPGFDPDRLELAREAMLQDLGARNDDPAAVEEREWRRLVYGTDHWLNRLPTSASVSSIQAEDCKRFAESLMRTGNFVVAVSGDFDRDEMLTVLERTVGALPRLEHLLPVVPSLEPAASQGVYVVDRPGLEQGRVRMGHLGLRQGHNDEITLQTLDHILGGGGFTSRMTREIRSTEGLAYSASSSMSFPAAYPGTFHADLQTASMNVARAALTTVELIRQAATTPVGPEELDTARRAIIGSFPRRFASAHRTAMRFAHDELTGLPHEHWATYRSAVRGLTPADLLTAAQRHLHPGELTILVVGDLTEIDLGHPDHAARLEDLGPVEVLPERNALTMEVLEH